MSSCPKRGGKEIAIKIATGIRKPPGISRIFSDTGLNAWLGQFLFVPRLKVCTYLNLIVVDSNEYIHFCN